MSQNDALRKYLLLDVYYILMKEPIGYEINEKDIMTTMRHLRIHDPANADQEYAIQVLELMHEIAKRVANAGLEFSELFLKTLKEKKLREAAANEVSKE